MAKEVVRPWYNASTGANNCVDTQFYADGSVDVRNSQTPDGPVITYTAAEWTAFVEGVKNGKFDPLTV